MIDMKMTLATKVRFLKPIVDEDFVEKGMRAWLTDIEWSSTDECYKLWFDFTDFEVDNHKYFKEVYHPNSRTAMATSSRPSPMFTAIESGYYHPKYSVLYSVEGDVRNDELFAQEIAGYLKELSP